MELILVVFISGGMVENSQNGVSRSLITTMCQRNNTFKKNMHCQEFSRFVSRHCLM